MKKDKDIYIIGGGFSGCFLAILLKENDPSLNVHIIEKSHQILKKVMITGNGRCNFANNSAIDSQYNHEEFVNPILEKFNHVDIVKFFSDHGIESKAINDLIYPYSETALSIFNCLNDLIVKLDIDVHLNESLIDYDQHYLWTNINKYHYDNMIFAFGSIAHDKNENALSIYEILKSHHYTLKQLSPSLCPIIVKENTKILDGLRHKVYVSIKQKDRLIHDESGELLFKKDGLSGIVIYNMSSYINRLENKDNITLHIDFAKGQEVNDYYAYLHPRLAKYLLANKMDIHDATFTFKDLYPFIYAQVVSGGIAIENLNRDLSSKLENNIYFIGEAIDVDAICGGYNIMFALSSAYTVYEQIKNRD